MRAVNKSPFKTSRVFLVLLRSELFILYWLGVLFREVDLGSTPAPPLISHMTLETYLTASYLPSFFLSSFRIKKFFKYKEK